MDQQDALIFYGGRRMAIENLVHKITARVDEKDIDWAWNLRYLLALEKAEYIGIEILGLGPLDQNNLRTEQKIMKISRVIRRLADRYSFIDVSIYVAHQRLHSTPAYEFRNLPSD
jgi:hypothetical protein